jgi:hypothetical protein
MERIHLAQQNARRSGGLLGETALLQDLFAP